MFSYIYQLTMNRCSTPKKVKPEHTTPSKKKKRCSKELLEHSHTPTGSLDHRWYARVYSLLSDFVFMESALAWLNTMGGAYSSLGERSKHHARVAHNIATKQLAIADKLNDSRLVTQCNLYMAFGLLQQEKYKPAQHIIADQMKSSNVTGRRAEEKLYQMCLSAKERLRFGRRKVHTANQDLDN